MIQKFWSLPCSFVQRRFWETYHAPFKRTSADLYNDASIFSLYYFVELLQNIIYGPLHTTGLFSGYRIIIEFESESFKPRIFKTTK